ncbi:hypothetical protein AHF37_12440 [Paragonimus kellicotti]|nr:hypothetical protein AHF37_12440 [Paragonimus kellicotti]
MPNITGLSVEVTLLRVCFANWVVCAPPSCFCWFAVEPVAVGLCPYFHRVMGTWKPQPMAHSCSRMERNETEKVCLESTGLVSPDLRCLLE